MRGDRLESTRLAKQPLKIGVRAGAGDPPFLWTVAVLQVAFDEALSFLGVDQYRRLARQFQELASQGDPTHSDTISLDKIEDFYELRDWGGILSPHNVRVFFGIDNALKRIVTLGVFNKRNDGSTPKGTVVTMRARWRKYRNGEFG